MRHPRTLLLLALVAASHCACAQEASITVQADKPSHPVSRLLTGACIEDVNHEVYGGIDSQMIFGESFAEPAPPSPLKGFKAYGGSWIPAADGSMQAAGGDGPKLLYTGSEFEEGQVSVEIMFNRKEDGNAGLIVKVSEAAAGADQFNGYEVSLQPSGLLVLGRHRQNWEPIRQVPSDVPLNQWVTLSVKLGAKILELFVNGKSMLQYEDADHPLARGAAGLRTWRANAQFRNFTVTADGVRKVAPFAYEEATRWNDGVSGMWRPFRRGTAEGEFSIEKKDAFSGVQCQRISFSSGAGEFGIENQGLNRCGMSFVKDKDYEGYIWARSESPTEAFVSLESKDGKTEYAQQSLKLHAGNWTRLDFSLRPNATDNAGRFAIKLKKPGALTLGYAFLQPGSWGRFKGLPVRKDVAEGLVDQGVTVLRYGGCMANAAEYRWKKMIGPRAQRPPYAGWWYPQASNGWGIFDFLNFCEAAGFAAIPDVNLNETPQDMADFIEYANGSHDSAWGRKRAEDGHPKPYALKYLQIGNEEQVNENYWQKFKPIAEAVWAKDASIILVVGDFAYNHPIKDPDNFTGADGRITNLSAHRKILQLAKQHNREVWFDVHVWTDGPLPNSSLAGMFSFIDALDRIAGDAKHKVVVFELNAANPSQRRALANALALNAIARDGRLPITTSANCLQPDGQNDNGWDQGLLFLNPSKVWLQPPGYVTQMFARNYQPTQVPCQVTAGNDTLDACASTSADARTLVLRVINPTDKEIPAQIRLAGFVPRQPVAQISELAGPLTARNTAAQPDAITPRERQWQHGLKDGATSYAFPPYSVNVLLFK